MDYQGFDAYEQSIEKIEGCTIFMAKDDGHDTLIVLADDGADAEKLDFTGVALKQGIKAPLTHKNALALRKLFPHTAPSQILRKDRSFGVGDRLGIAALGHIRIFEQYDAYPVFAQQSIRELNLTCRTYEDVLDAVSFAVFREGYRKGWGADGDHLKTVEDLEYALGLGFSMITLDCSDHIKTNVTAANAKSLPQAYKDKYLGKQFDIGEGVSLCFDEEELKKIVTIYSNAINFAADMYTRFLRDGVYKADFEISIDETSEPTTPLQHYFVARELIDAGVSFITLAPRFCGEFQKGIDYIGDLVQFEKEIKVHAVIARHFKYKLSIHSGSDKFSVFPCIGRETRGVFHVKTAGTNWLEAMRIVAVADPALYREVHKYAFSAFSEAAKYYHVTTDLSKIPCVDSLKDGELPGLFANNDARQLIHITYGLILNKKDSSGAYEFKDRLYKLWHDKEELYAEALLAHIGKHLDMLGVKKIS
jgi:hypothetical protein